ncbi:hypothetical protein BS50DRAFT_279214 [Corynespora cassiicola Philippines]|uniref:Fermentation associated protein n=1 Tax=Corynespora cassiicola Philippines TaxID=1448308 RepID=A0A2T2P0R2_CORCC|nr:hypothetical protein BS50DRAFT_279214 [Corynespora cassiicola Philippines]
MANSIVSEPLNPHNGFNWVFLVELLICAILTIFFLFYFNRLFATLVSYGIRAYTWRAFHAYIDIQALQISLLGGRLFFKDIRYHGHNQTILIHGGYITWNYWMRRVKDAEVFGDEGRPETSDRSETTSTQSGRHQGRNGNIDKAEKGGKNTPKKLKCRISVKVQGVEAFMYNRSPAYDGIIEAMKRKTSVSSSNETEHGDDNGNGHAKNGSASSFQAHEEGHNKLRKAPASASPPVPRAETYDTTAPSTKKEDLPAFLRLLPIHIDCNKGAIVVGNEHTQAVITAQFERATGQLDASHSGPLDVYQQVFNFQFTHPVVHMKPNPDFKALQLETAGRLKHELDQDEPEEFDEKHVRPTPRKSWLSSLPSISGLFSKSSDSIHTHTKTSGRRGSKIFAPQWHLPGQERWKGLTRYLDESLDDGHGEWDGVEYAKASLIVDCPCVNVSFYWDVTGPVPNELDNSIHADPSRPMDVNGSVPPEYGMDIQVYGGIINYGPWADRHRGIFQNIFFPGAHVDAVPTTPLSPGETRVLSIFKIYLGIEEETILRIPVREPSKDWKWKGKAHTLAGQDKKGSDKTKGKARTRRKSMSMRGKQRDAGASAQNVRPYAWIDVKVAGNSSVNYIMDMVASEKGFQNKLAVDLSGAEIFSSVNHGLLWRSGALGLDCNLSNPLSWNSLRKWMFNISCKDLELFLLRDHLFLLTDLVSDWGSGPPSDYFTFVPFQYLLNIDFTNFKLYLNTNDANIVNNPSELDDNNFIILLGQRLHGDLVIPLDKFRPSQNEIKFDVQVQDMGLEVCMPSKNTLNTFLKSKDVAQLGGLTLKGSYTYMTDTSPMNTDRLFMDIHGDRLHVELYGWLVHHFMKIKDNYFGDDMHFKTLEEYQGLPTQSLATDSTTPNGQVAKASNDLDVILCISVDRVGVLLPANLYSAENSLRADLPYVSAELRFTNYYMDLMVNFSPISLSLGTSVTSPGLPRDISGRTEVFIDSIVIFGHRLFGLPPVEPTYVCNWDFEIGKITGECTSDFIEKAAGAARSFAFTFDDDENTITVSEIPIIHDSTFLRLQTQEINLWLHIANEAVLIRTGPMGLDFNDLAGTTFSQRLNAWIPDLTVGAVDAKFASRHRTRTSEKHIVKTHAFLQTTLSVTMFRRKIDFTEDRNKQQEHMQEHDARTNRTQFMFMDNPSSFRQRTRNQDNVRPPAMQFPEIPQPIFMFRPPDTETLSSASSGYSSNSAFARGRQPRAASIKSASGSSLARSVRASHRGPSANNTAEFSRSRTLLGTSPSRSESPGHFFSINDGDRAKRNLAPSSLALSSSLAAPYFPLDQVEPDLSDVPDFPDVIASLEDDGDDAIYFNDVSTKHLDETFDHTSLLFSIQPGIRIHCTPEAVRCVANLIQLIEPHRPEDMLDDFQVKVMTQILDHQKRREGKGSSLELSVRIPFVHVRFQNEFAAHSQCPGGKDQYDLILNQLRVAARIKKYPGDQAEQDSVAFHTTLGSLGVSITERSLEKPHDDVAVQAEISDLLVWMLKNKETSVNVAFKSFETATASKKIEYLAALIHRSTVLGEELAGRFAENEEIQKHRLRYLAWFLTSVQDQYPDPTFLTKASYALRATKEHLRSHDSWKIVSRFRFIWHCLPEVEKSKVLDNCCSRDFECPEGAEERIITMWDQWRTWDLAHVKKSLAMKVLFGSDVDEVEESHPGPIYLDIRSAGVKLIIDPGPKQSETAMHIISINVALVPPPEPEGLMLLGTEIPRKSTIVQVNSGESSVHIRWEICKLVEMLAQMFQEDSVRRSEQTPPRSPHPVKKKAPTEDHDLQVVFVTEKAEVCIDTINIRSLSTGRRFRLSVAGEDRMASSQQNTITALIHLEQGVTELMARNRLLLRAQCDRPSLYFAHTEYGNDDAPPSSIKVAGASRMIKLHVQEDILGFIEIVDSVLRDEVAYFVKQSAALKRPSTPAPKPAEPEKSTQLPNITVALLMDAYVIELALLQSLTWAITGRSGRVAVTPSLGKNVTLRVDYDLEGHTHRMFGSKLEGSNVISSLELPPVNGRLRITNSENETRISASGIIETINLQASEVQALVATINKPEISSVVKAIQDDVKILQNHIEEIFPETSQSPVVKAPDSSRDIIFSVKMTLSGLNILANAPGKLPGSATANLAVRLGSLQLNATNLGPDQTIMSLPEAIVHLHEIKVDLTLSDAESVRRCGSIAFGATFQATSQKDAETPRRVYRVHSSGLQVSIFADTASAVVDVMNHLQDKIKDLDLSREKKYLRRLRHTRSKISHKRDKSEKDIDIESVSSGALFTSTYSLELLNLQVSWIVGTSITPYPNTESEDLVLSFRRINFSTKKDDVARLSIDDMQLQMVPVSADKKVRSVNSALLPQVVFNVAYSSTKDTRKIAFHAAGKSLDLRLDSRFILPANVIERSIALAGKKFRTASADWNMTPTTSGAQRKNPFGNKRLASLLVESNFAGAVVHINGNQSTAGPKESRQQKGRYSQFAGDSSQSSMALRAPGVALKVEYIDDGHDPSLNAELRIDGSNNILYPTVVPIMIDISDSIKRVVQDKDEGESPDTDKPEASPTKPAAKLLEEDNLITADPSAILGRTQLNLGLRICKQEFSLSCQPIARVAAIAKIDDIYVTVNSVKSQEHGHFFAASATFEKLQATVQHVYSRESTFGFDVDSIVLSLMNSKHLSGTSGISAILKINPMGLQINARQLQDFLLFREIWIPPEIRRPSKPPPTNVSQEPQEFLMQRYQQVTAATAFPWNANVSIADVAVELDLGQAIGKTSLHIHNMWASSKKGTDWEQNLCIGVEKIGVESTGRTSGFVELAGVKVRTSISWPSEELGFRQTPLIQASLGFHQLRVKAGFDYQAFVIADITNFDFLMYNVREQLQGSRDRLVAILDGDKVHVFCTATSAAQGLALYQAIERLVQENQQAYTQSLKDIEKFLRRKSSVSTPYSQSASQSMVINKPDDSESKTPISLHTDVVVTLRSINVGVYPSTFVDSQILMLEAADVQARFAVALEHLEHHKIHSGLGMTLGQLSVALSSIPSPKKTKPVGELTVEEIVESARSARGGTILRVPKVIASMHTWQAPNSTHIDYIFKSSLEGKVDVGWNYSRISYIRSMWSNHSRTLASRLGKPLPESNIKITSSASSPKPAPAAEAGTEPESSTAAATAVVPPEPQDKGEDADADEKDPAAQEKITAVVNVPQSRYEYTPLEPPLIETPQLRDMGEATPPLEWIGLHRDRLPNVTHQIVIVTLLEVAREVEEAYERILGTS